MKLVGKLNILFNIQFLCSIPLKNLCNDLFSMLNVLLLKRIILKSYKKIIIIKIIIIKKAKIKIFKLKENLKISFEARDVMYINKINIPPIKIKNKEYENQYIKEKLLVNKAINKVCSIKINPMDKG